MRLIDKFKSMSYEERCIFTVKFSITLNSILALGKFGLAIYKLDVFFFVAGVINILLMLAKVQCYSGLRLNKKADDTTNLLVALFLGLSGIQYTVYMSRLIFNDVPLNDYGPIISVLIAAVAFTELGIALYGCFKVAGKGYFLKNVKLINFSSALIAIVLTEVALMTFAETDMNLELISGLFGVIVGIIIFLIAVYVLIQAKVSILGKERNVYKYINGDFKQEKISIKLTDSKFYADYSYEANIVDNMADGMIIKGKNPIKSWNIWILILVITLSEILIFPYAVGALIRHFKEYKMLEDLDNKMKELGFEKVDIE